jgi:putative methyltransferase (TIGR04325 family)
VFHYAVLGSAVFGGAGRQGYPRSVPTTPSGVQVKLPPRLRAISKALIPFGVVEAVRERRARPKQLWRGSYAGFDQVPVFGSGHASSEWIAPEAEATSRFRRNLMDASRLQRDAFPRYALLPGAVSGLWRPGEKLRVVDFGGGVGIAYVYFAPAIPAELSYDYYVVDNAPSCEAGREIFKDDPRVHFCEEIDEVNAADVIFMSGVLQYISDYRGVVAKLAALKPRLFVLTLTPVGEFPTFAAEQINLPNSSFAHWFFNRQEFVQMFANEGYFPSYRASVEQSFDMSNYPAHQQLLQMSSWVFTRNQ